MLFIIISDIMITVSYEMVAQFQAKQEVWSISIQILTLPLGMVTKQERYECRLFVLLETVNFQQKKQHVLELC